jgi:hypothetical protein
MPPIEMTYSERFLSGFALAATVASDRGAARARAGLHPAIVETWTQPARALAALSKHDRRARVRAWMEPEAYAWPRAARAPLMAWALIAQRVRERAPAWLQHAPMPRAGYTPEPELVALLTRIARRAGTSWDA